MCALLRSFLFFFFEGTREQSKETESKRESITGNDARPTASCTVCGGMYMPPPFTHGSLSLSLFPPCWCAQAAFPSQFLLFVSRSFLLSLSPCVWVCVSVCECVCVCVIRLLCLSQSQFFLFLLSPLFFFAVCMRVCASSYGFLLVNVCLSASLLLCLSSLFFFSAGEDEAAEGRKNGPVPPRVVW